ncbi:MAG: DUF2628 domain-containing protein [Alphaproteobacteria bacterium]|nr:DUF2628 domain-containing protein [Alphaproteobacteria bacterium]MBM3624272.1 DUF2628 domain-containing protein [Alphaproteobacteria bacterium]
MAIFTVHVPRTASGQLPAPDRIVFLRDGFSWPAFVFGPFWLAWRRAWIVAGLWTLLLVALALLAWKLRVSREAIYWLTLALAVWLGFEGGRLVGWNLARRGYVERDLVVGEDIDEAETVFFLRHRSAEPIAKEDIARGPAP